MTPRDRMGRAEDYVLGLMDEHERQRAERDMEVDPEFRQCVLALAQKLQRLHDLKRPAASADEAWNEIAARIASLPHMAGEAIRPPAGRRSALRPAPQRAAGRGLHTLGGRQGLAVALALAAVFALGYLAAGLP